MTEVACKFRADLDLVHEALRSLPESLADVPWREGGWTRKQIVGHLLDSAANNRQRFVRASCDGTYSGPKYAQDAWVVAHGYSDQNWATLLSWWQTEHEILTAVVDLIPEHRLETPCVVGDNAPVTLQFLIEDYVEHQKWHLKQLLVAS
ncbi:MAG: DinB family protein [Acidobacteria bacterium]|nr:DinB family protein [Acidobacteriota bacterium]